MARAFHAHRLHQTVNGRHIRPSHYQHKNFTIGGNKFGVLPIICQHVHEGHASGIFYGENPLHYTFTLLLFEVSLVILITRIVRFLLKPLKQPRIISEIIGGIIVGPSVLRHKRSFATNIMPESAEFLVRNIGIIGFMFFVFVYGVKMDSGLVTRSKKKHVSIALIGIIVPTVAVFLVALVMRKNMDKELAKLSSIGGVASYLGITSFPVLHNVLKDYNLLNSDVGRMALSMAIIGDILGAGTIVIFEAGKQGETGAINALWFLISLILLLTFIMTFLSRAMEWIIEKTPEGQPVDQSYIVAILLGVFVMSFLTDMFGISIANGSLWLGLVIPDGPPLGATLVAKTETIMMELLMPFSFIMVGYYTDVLAMSAVGWSNLAPLFAMVITGYLTKFVSTWIATIIWRMPYKDGLAVSLIMSLRGQIELLLFLHWMDKKMIKTPGFTLLVLMTTVLTSTFTPLICIFFDPTKPYMVAKRRTIQHSPANAELRIVLSILDRERIRSLINLLDVSNPTLDSPFSVFALQLIELEGRAAPVFIDHELQEVPPKYKCTRTANALNFYQQRKGDEKVKLHSFTVVATKRSMYQNICEVAVEHKATFIIVPFFHMDHGTRSCCSHVLAHAPCSVGILVDKGSLENTTVGRSFRFAVLFLGGADAREALVYADRMVNNQEQVSLTVIRFLSHNYEGDEGMEKKLDDGIITQFWVKNESNQRVVYREVVVNNGEETIAAIQAMNQCTYDLWIVGRKQGINAILLSGLSDWSENEQLGLIGDYVASVDFSSSASVLVVHQQILRG